MNSNRLFKTWSAPEYELLREKRMSDLRFCHGVTNDKGVFNQQYLLIRHVTVNLHFVKLLFNNTFPSYLSQSPQRRNSHRERPQTGSDDTIIENIALSPMSCLFSLPQHTILCPCTVCFPSYTNKIAFRVAYMGTQFWIPL